MQEIYIHHLVDAAYTQARLDKRKAVVYKDVARAIKNTPHLDFLMDVVPMAMPLSQALAARQRHSDYAVALETTGSSDAAGVGINGGNANGSTEYAGLAEETNGHHVTQAQAAEMDLDPTSADQMNRHGLPPLASHAAGDRLRERVGSVEDA